MCSLTLLDVPKRIAVPGVFGVNCQQIPTKKLVKYYNY